MGCSDPSTPAMIAGKSVDQWLHTHPLLRDMVALREVTWFNPALAPAAQALGDVGLGRADVDAAAARLARFAPWLAQTFPDTAAAAGVIESPLRELPAMHEVLQRRYGVRLAGPLWAKLDSHLPVSGSIKARGGVHEVLQHAEALALRAGVLRETDDYRVLAGAQARELFAAHRLAVGSTGNLGLSVGIVGAALGLSVTVHMSADAREWKKRRLRACGVTVVEHAADYGDAVREGRRQALQDAACHFVDDERSRELFLGYAVAALRLRGQLDAAGVRVDSRHPLWVYLPCGVGGGPGGVAFGLKLVFGDAVHCVFAEPTHAPCMLLGLHTGLHDAVSVQDFGIDNRTAADGLAVGRASGFVAGAMQRLVDACYTVDDDELFELLALLDGHEGLRLEPSAVAGLCGPARLRPGDAAQPGTHLVWFTGGSMVPAEELQSYVRRGREISRPGQPPAG